jgi:hypothetical protein
MSAMELAVRALQVFDGTKNNIFPPFAKYDGMTSFFGGVP